MDGLELVAIVTDGVVEVLLVDVFEDDTETEVDFGAFVDVGDKTSTDPTATTATTTMIAT